VKISVSLPSDDVAVLDAYVRSSGAGSRSAALHHAVDLLRRVDLVHDYEAAMVEWESSSDEGAWDVAVADGLDDAARGDAAR